MADDINKKITIDVEVTTDGQQQVQQYTAAFNNLRTTISNLGKPLSDISTNIQALDKDISNLSNSVNKLNAQNQAASDSNNKIKDSLVSVADSYNALNTIIPLVKKGIAALEAGFVSLEGALTGGLSLIIAFAPEIIKWTTGLFSADKTTKSLNQTLREHISIVKAVSQARLQGDQNAQAELVHLKLLYNASQDQKLSLTERKKAITELQSQYPNYLGNISSETILAGKATTAYKKLTEAILANSRAKAAEDLLVKNSTRQLEDSSKLTDLQSQKEAKQAEIDAAEKAYRSRPNKGDRGRGSTDENQLDNIRQLRDELNGLQKQYYDASNDSLILDKQNAALAKSITDNTEKVGVQTLTGINNANSAAGQRLKNTTKVQAQVLSESEQLQQDSLTKQLQATYQAYGSEAAEATQHYQDELKQLQEQLNKKQITKQQANEADKALQTAYQNEMSAIMNKFNQQDAEQLQQTQNELAELQIKGIKNATEKQIAELTQQQIEKEQQYDKADAQTLERINKLRDEIAAIQKANPNADVSKLQETLNTESAIRAANNKKRVEDEQQTANAIAQINKQDDETKKESKDQSAIDGAKSPSTKLAAEKQLIIDKYQFEIDQAQGNSKKIVALEAERDQKIKALDQKSIQDRQKAELQAAQQVEAAAFSLLSSSIKQQSDSKVAALEKDKAAELDNSSLTSAQKLAINAKYKKQEDQVKAKAFKQEQELSIAQAVINGALAVTKVSAQSGILAALSVGVVIAETAAEVAKIASQKPPAYAKGGLHYTSDGRGGVLPGYSRTDNTNAYLRSGEGIVVSEAMRDPWARNLVSAINVGFGGRDFSTGTTGRGFAVGGIFTDGGDANRYYNQPVTDNKNLANSIAYQMVNNFPPVYVDVKDINNQQNILAQTINRVNL